MNDEIEQILRGWIDAAIVRADQASYWKKDLERAAEALALREDEAYMRGRQFEAKICEQSGLHGPERKITSASTTTPRSKWDSILVNDAPRRTS